MDRYAKLLEATKGRTSLTGEQPDPWDLLQPTNHAKSFQSLMSKRNAIRVLNPISYLNTSDFLAEQFPSVFSGEC